MRLDFKLSNRPLHKLCGLNFIHSFHTYVPKPRLRCSDSESGGVQCRRNRNRIERLLELKCSNSESLVVVNTEFKRLSFARTKTRSTCIFIYTNILVHLLLLLLCSPLLQLFCSTVQCMPLNIIVLGRRRNGSHISFANCNSLYNHSVFPLLSSHCRSGRSTSSVDKHHNHRIHQQQHRGQDQIAIRIGRSSRSSCFVVATTTTTANDRPVR